MRGARCRRPRPCRRGAPDGASWAHPRVATMSEPVGQVRDGFEGFDRLWTPHRMAYVAPAEPVDRGCPFCAMADQPLAESLVVHRGETCFAVLNLHPYNP